MRKRQAELSYRDSTWQGVDANDYRYSVAPRKGWERHVRRVVGTDADDLKPYIATYRETQHG